MIQSISAPWYSHDCVHRDVYIDPEIFSLEVKRIFARAWNYLCHESQLPDTGDYLTTDIAGNPVIVIRHDDHTCTTVVPIEAPRCWKIPGVTQAY